MVDDERDLWPFPGEGQRLPEGRVAIDLRRVFFFDVAASDGPCASKSKVAGQSDGIRVAFGIGHDIDPLGTQPFLRGCILGIEAVVFPRIHVLIAVQRIDPGDFDPTKVVGLGPIELVLDIRLFDFRGKPPPPRGREGIGIELRSARGSVRARRSAYDMAGGNGQYD